MPSNCYYINMQKLIILRGYPGSGKTTIGKALGSKGLGIFIDHNEILSFIAKITGDDDGIYEEISLLEQAMAAKLLTEEKSVIVARGFSSAKSMQPYLDTASIKNIPAFIIRLEASLEILERRVVSPERKEGFNPTTEPEALKRWVSGNQLQSVPRECIVEADKDPQAIVNEITKLLH